MTKEFDEAMKKANNEETKATSKWANTNYDLRDRALCYLQGSRDGFKAGALWAKEYLAKKNEGLAEALEWNAGTICLDDIYKQENNEQNRLNLLRNIRKAQEALEAYRRDGT